MRRRDFILLVSGATGYAVVRPGVLRAEALGQMPRIGMLWHAGSADEESIYLAAFRQGLADVGYVEGRNIIVEHRFPAEKPERFQSMAAELVELKLEVLVASGQPPALALQRATATIPIIFVAAYDPLGVGLVNSLARPSGNITGLSLPDLIGKRLEILKQALPNLSRVAVLINPANQSYAHRYGDSVQDDGHKLGLSIQPVEVNGPGDLERAFSAITPDPGTGVAAAADVMFYIERKRIAALALAHSAESPLIGRVACGAGHSATLTDKLRAMRTLVLLRHGESEWNSKGLFTGWVDVGLSATGADEAAHAGKLLNDSRLRPDVLHTSVLTRAIQTAQIALEAAELLWLPVHRSWRLNERHYGALQGKDKAQTRQEFGDEQFMLWRRSYDVPPPPIADDDPLSQAGDPRYALLPPELLPRTECLKDVLARMLPYWYEFIVPDLAAGRTVLVTAHGNSLRALVKHLDGISDDEIAGLNIPTGIPLVYELDSGFRPAERGGRYLDPQAAAEAAEAVKNQGR